MKIKITELRKIIRNCILEVTDPIQAADRVEQLFDLALSNPRLSSAPLFGFLRTLGAEGLAIRELKSALDSNDVELARAVLKKIVKNAIDVNLFRDNDKKSNISGLRRRTQMTHAAE